MNRMKRRQFRAKGFRPGNVPFMQTELRNVIIANQTVYQVKRRDKFGKIVELYETGPLRIRWIYLRFRVLWFKKFVAKNCGKLAEKLHLIGYKIGLSK